MSKFSIAALDPIKDEGTKNGEYTIFRFNVIREDILRNEEHAKIVVFLDTLDVGPDDGVEFYDPSTKKWKPAAQRVELDFLGLEGVQTLQVRVKADSTAEANEILRISFDPIRSLVKLSDGNVIGPEISAGHGTAVSVIRNDDGPVAYDYLPEIDRARKDGVITVAEKQAIDDACGEQTPEDKQRLDDAVHQARLNDLEKAIERAATDGKLTDKERVEIIGIHGDGLGAKTVIDKFDARSKELRTHEKISYEEQHFAVDAREWIFGTANDDNLELPMQGVAVIGDMMVDLLNGGSAVFAMGGFDTVHVNMPFDPEALVLNDDGSVLLRDIFGAHNSLYDVERIAFSDYTVAFDVTGTSGQVYRLYQAAFDRTPDVVGLSFNVHLVDKGLTLQQMSDAFVVSAEFRSINGQNPTDLEFLTALYHNVLDRDPDPAGLAGWQQLLASGQLDRGDVLIGFSESLENHMRVDPAIVQGIVLDPQQMLL